MYTISTYKKGESEHFKFCYILTLYFSKGT